MRDISFTIRAGTVNGLVGPNGSGKSTIIRLLLRYAEPDFGTITWDGVDIREYPPTAYRRHITGVLQDRVHYELTLGDNIWLGALDRHGDIEALSAALDEVGLREVAEVKRLNAASLLSPMRSGDDGGSGTMLSGGEWERVTGADAHRLGLVNQLADDPFAAALELAGEIAVRSPMGVRQAKELLNASLLGGLHAHLEIELRSQVLCAMTDDHAEAKAAFRARREPVFRDA